MTWTAEKIDKGFSGGYIYVRVQYSNPGFQSFEETYRANTIQPDWPDAQMRQRLLELNALDIDQVALGLPSDAPVVDEPIPPTPEQLAQRKIDIANQQLIELKRKSDAQKWAETQTDPAVVDLLAQVKP